MPPAARQLALQAGAALLVAGAAWAGRNELTGVLSWLTLALAVGGVAGLLAWLTRQPVWWRFIHAGFLPLAWGVSTLAIPPEWFLLIFLALLLVYRGAVTGRVPLYLSNAATAARLADLARQRQVRHLADLGAGIGTIVRRLAQAEGGLAVTGVENAPATWLAGWLALRLCPRNCVHWRYDSLWDVDLSPFDLVYVFLSPEPMPALWDKAQSEMAPGTLLVSNSFPIPDTSPVAVIAVADRRKTVLYCYAVPSRITDDPAQTAAESHCPG